MCARGHHRGALSSAGRARHRWIACRRLLRRSTPVTTDDHDLGRAPPMGSRIHSGVIASVDSAQRLPFGRPRRVAGTDRTAPAPARTTASAPCSGSSFSQLSSLGRSRATPRGHSRSIQTRRPSVDAGGPATDATQPVSRSVAQRRRGDVTLEGEIGRRRSSGRDHRRRNVHAGTHCFSPNRPPRWASWFSSPTSALKVFAAGETWSRAAG
jgi:hypothetical protein